VVEGNAVVPLQSGHTLFGGAAIGEQLEAYASEMAGVVNFGFPAVGSPLDGIRDDAWHAFGDTVCSDDVEAFGIAGLQQQVHVPDGLTELRPGLPAVFDELYMREAVHHLLHGVDDGPGAFVAPGGDPELEIGAAGVGDFDGGSGGGEQVFQSSRGAEGSDAERAAVIQFALRRSGGLEMVEVRQAQAGSAISGLDPATQTFAVGRDLKVPGGATEFEAFADEAHGARVGLEEAEVGVAGHGETGFGEVGAELREFRGLYPGSGNNDVRRSGFVKPGAKLLSIDNRPDIRLDAFGAHALCSIERGYTESDMAYRAVGGEVFVSECDLHLPKR